MSIFTLSILIAALIFLYPLSLFRKIYAMTKGLQFRSYWTVLFVFCTLFLVSYLGTAFHGYFLVYSETTYQAITIVILGTGSVFVALVAHLFSNIIGSLDGMVERRTVELRKAYDETLEREKENQRLKDQFLFIAAHELRTPVTAIKWSVDYLCSEVEIGRKCSQEQLETLQDLKENNEYLIELVNDLLDTSRIEYGSFSLKKRQVDPRQVIEEAANTVSGLAKERGVGLQWDVDRDIGKVVTDPRRLKEVLVNLLGNAIKYNVDGGRVEMEARKRGKELLISVRDSGIGISAVDLDKLFVKFYRVENDGGHEIRGTGLGLYISKEIVTRLGGELKAESEGLGKGSTFSFTIPL